MTEIEPREASVLNRKLTDLLVSAGQAMDFTVETEYQVPGGRIDVMWSWTPPQPIPGLVGSVPVVGFEIESSWRTRKHVKGDLLNLQDAGVAVGVIVVAGVDPRDDSLRRFATSLVDRPGQRVLVWTEADVRTLAVGGPRLSTVEEAAEIAATETPAWASASSPMPAQAAHRSPGPTVDHAGKYQPLWAWLRSQEPAGAPLVVRRARDRRRHNTPRLLPASRRPLAQLPGQCHSTRDHRRRLARQPIRRERRKGHFGPGDHRRGWCQATDRTPPRCSTRLGHQKAPSDHT